MAMKNVRQTLHCAMLLMAMLVGGVFSSYAEMVRGNVTDDTGEALIGVTVMVVGVPGGVATDIDGNYQINVPNLKKGELRLSLIHI